MADNEAVLRDVGASSIGKPVAEEGESGSDEGETRSDVNGARTGGVTLAFTSETLIIVKRLCSAIPTLLSLPNFTPLCHCPCRSNYAFLSRRSSYLLFNPRRYSLCLAARDFRFYRRLTVLVMKTDELPRT